MVRLPPATPVAEHHLRLPVGAFLAASEGHLVELHVETNFIVKVSVHGYETHERPACDMVGIFEFLSDQGVCKAFAPGKLELGPRVSVEPANRGLEEMARLVIGEV